MTLSPNRKNMNKIHAIICLTAVLMGLTACQEKKQYVEAEVFSYADMPEEKTLHGEVVKLDDVYMPSNLYLKDSLLFMVNLRSQNMVTYYNLNRLEKTSDFISFGSGPDECLSIASLQFRNDEIWAFDLQQGKIQVYPYEQFLQAGQAKVKRSIALQDATANGAVAVKDRLFVNSLAHADARFSLYDMAGNLLEQKGKMPDFRTAQTELEKWESFFCNMAVRPDEERVFVAYMQTDLVEIYDERGNLLHRMHGPDGFFPVKNEREVGGGQRKVMSTSGKTRDAYFYPVAFDDEIWTVYSGKVFEPQDHTAYLMDKILVFDWNGRVQRFYRLDIPIYTLAVDRQQRMIYGMSEQPDLSIVRFQY